MYLRMHAYLIILPVSNNIMWKYLKRTAGFKKEFIAHLKSLNSLLSFHVKTNCSFICSFRCLRAKRIKGYFIKLLVRKVTLRKRLNLHRIQKWSIETFEFTQNLKVIYCTPSHLKGLNVHCHLMSRCIVYSSVILDVFDNECIPHNTSSW